MSEEGQTLFDKYGGMDTVKALVDLFYIKLLDDKRTSVFFKGRDVQRIKNHQYTFVASVLGSPNAYDGMPLRSAHSHLNITDDDYDAVLELLCDSMDELGVKEEDMETVVGKLEFLRPEVTNQ